MAYYSFHPPFYSSSTPQFYSPSATIPAPLPSLTFSHGYTPPSPNPYTSSNPYCYGNAGSSGYYNTYKQQPPPPYSQHVRASQNSEMVIAIFDGNEDAYGWLLCTEKFFRAKGTPEEAKLTVAAMALRGRTLHWWLWWSQRHPESTWEPFTTAFLWQFKPEFRDVLPLCDDEEAPPSVSWDSVPTVPVEFLPPAEHIEVLSRSCHEDILMGLIDASETKTHDVQHKATIVKSTQPLTNGSSSSITADPGSTVAEDRKKSVPKVLTNLELPIPALVSAKKVLHSFEDRNSDLSPVVVPPHLDVVSPVRSNPQTPPDGVSVSPPPPPKPPPPKPPESNAFTAAKCSSTRKPVVFPRLKPPDNNPTPAPPPKPPYPSSQKETTRPPPSFKSIRLKGPNLQPSLPFTKETTEAKKMDNDKPSAPPSQKDPLPLDQHLVIMEDKSHTLTRSTIRVKVLDATAADHVFHSEWSLPLALMSIPRQLSPRIAIFEFPFNLPTHAPSKMRSTSVLNGPTNFNVGFQPQDHLLPSLSQSWPSTENTIHVKHFPLIDFGHVAVRVSCMLLKMHSSGSHSNFHFQVGPTFTLNDVYVVSLYEQLEDISDKELVGHKYAMVMFSYLLQACAHYLLNDPDFALYGKHYVEIAKGILREILLNLSNFWETFFPMLLGKYYLILHNPIEGAWKILFDWKMLLFWNILIIWQMLACKRENIFPCVMVRDKALLGRIISAGVTDLMFCVQLGQHEKSFIGLVGYCGELEHAGFAPNCSLFEYMMDIAYLHLEVKPSLIHRDIKPSNIPLEEGLEAKVSDCKLPKSGPPGDQLHASSQFPACCSRNYLPKFSDNYSFRVIQLLLIFSVSIGKGLQWDPGGHFGMSKAVQSSQFKQWDPGKFVQGNFYNLEDKVVLMGSVLLWSWSHGLVWLLGFLLERSY